MADDLWGTDTPAAIAQAPPLPPGLARLEAFVAGKAPFNPPGGWERPTEADLPEVAALAKEGWLPVGADPQTRLLPAVWPPEHRAWVPDRLPHVTLCMTPERTWIEPTRAERRAEWEADFAEEAAAAGFPPPPPGRIWLLRSPWPSLSTAMVLAVLQQWREEHGRLMDPRGLVPAAREVLTWTEDEIWDRWHGPEAEAARAWRATGRPAVEVSELVLAGLGPEETARLTAPTEDCGARLTEAQAAWWVGVVRRPTVDEAVAAVIGWRALGVAARPRGRLWWTLEEMEPVEAAEWLAEGFSLEDVAVFREVADRETARAWREHGYAAERAQALLLADPSLTPEEATAFDRAGFDEESVVAWVEAGFTPEQARAWAEVDVLPGEARVWRSVALGPDDARRQKASGGGWLPQGVEVGWAALGSDGREFRRYGVIDPPGTRGSLAAGRHEVDFLN